MVYLFIPQNDIYSNRNNYSVIGFVHYTKFHYGVRITIILDPVLLDTPIRQWGKYINGSIDFRWQKVYYSIRLQKTLCKMTRYLTFAHLFLWEGSCDISINMERLKTFINRSSFTIFWSVQTIGCKHRHVFSYDTQEVWNRLFPEVHNCSSYTRKRKECKSLSKIHKIHYTFAKFQVIPLFRTYSQWKSQITYIFHYFDSKFYKKTQERVMVFSWKGIIIRTTFKDILF